MFKFLWSSTNSSNDLLLNSDEMRHRRLRRSKQPAVFSFLSEAATKGGKSVADNFLQGETLGSPSTPSAPSAAGNKWINVSFSLKRGKVFPLFFALHLWNSIRNRLFNDLHSLPFLHNLSANLSFTRNKFSMIAICVKAFSSTDHEAFQLSIYCAASVKTVV